MIIRRPFKIAVTLVVFFVTCGLAVANTAVERGTDIAKAVELGDQGYGDEVVHGEMIIRSRDQTTARRSFKMFTLEVLDGGDKRVVVFEEPRDLAGFVSLNHSQLLEADKQWIYLPASSRTRRLSARDKTGAFAGSEFTFEDIVRWEFEKYEYESLGKKECAAQLICEVVVDYPRYEYSGYRKLVEAIDMEILQPRKIDYYDLQDRAYKTLELLDYQQISGHWRPMKLVMTNHITGDISEINWRNYKFRNGLSDKEFKPSRIKKWVKLD